MAKRPELLPWPTSFLAQLWCYYPGQKNWDNRAHVAQARDLSSMHAPMFGLRACLNFFGQGSTTTGSSPVVHLFFHVWFIHRYDESLFLFCHLGLCVAYIVIFNEIWSVLLCSDWRSSLNCTRTNSLKLSFSVFVCRHAHSQCCPSLKQASGWL